MAKKQSQRAKKYQTSAHFQRMKGATVAWGSAETGVNK